MGFKVVDITTVATNGPTETSPPGKEIKVKAFSVARTDTTAKLGCVIKANATVIGFRIFGVKSNAATTATLSFGTSTNANEWVSGADVKTTGGFVLPTGDGVVQAALPNLEAYPLGGSVQVYAKYAETGTASTSGGPWTVVIEYVE